MPKFNSMPTRNLVSHEASAMLTRAAIPRSRFIGEKTRLTTFNAGILIPFYIDEMVPGDHFKIKAHPYVRINTPLFPLFSNFRVDTHFFVCPVRLVWPNFVKMMGEQDNPGDSINYTTPRVTSPVGGFAVASLQDYFGIPTIGQVDPAQATTINNLFGRMYNLTWNEWYRDENNIASAVVDLDDGPDTATDYGLRRRAKSPDFFTKALPFAQKGTSPSVAFGGGLAPIRGIGFVDGAAAPYSANVPVTETDGGNRVYPLSLQSANFATQNIIFEGVDFGGSGVAGDPLIYADLNQLSGSTGVNINDIRTALMIQSLLEQNARHGTRYTEIVQGEFGITSEDYRLQRPEYIGGGSTPLNISPIAQTAPTAGLTVGALGAAGVATGQHFASYAAREHCLIMGLISVKSELQYQQGIHKMHQRQTRYQWYTPKLALLGEQAILREEIYHTGVPGDDAMVFGYQAAWDDMRQMYNDITGRFRSTAASTLDAWHSGQEFSPAPTLGFTFIGDNPPMPRVLAAGQSATDLHMEFLAEILIERDAVRPMPTHSVPAFLGRF